MSAAPYLIEVGAAGYNGQAGEPIPIVLCDSDRAVRPTRCECALRPSRFCRRHRWDERNLDRAAALMRARWS